MRQQRGLAGLLGLLLVLLLSALLASPAQAAPANTSRIETATGKPFGVSADGALTINEDAALGSKLGIRSGNSTAALCNQPSYVQVFQSGNLGNRLITIAPGNTIHVNAFMTLLHQGVTYPGTRAIFYYRWNNNTAGFDYYTSFSMNNCVINQEPNPLSPQNFPVGVTVTVYVAFVPWESGQVVGPGQLGFIIRDF